MKSFLKFLPIAAAVLLATSCSKDDNAPANGRDGVHTVSTSTIPFTIRVNTGRSLKKVGYAKDPDNEGYYNISFTDDDVDNLKMIIKENGTQIGEATLQSDKSTFSGGLTKQPSSNTADLTAEISVIPKDAKTFSDESLAALLATCAHTFLGTFNYGDKTVDLTDQNAYLAISMSPCCDHEITINSDGYTVKDGRIWIAISADADVTSTGLGSEISKKAEEVSPGTIYTVARQYFTVADGKKVYFSKGNLQYNPKQNQWKFADNQYDYIGGTVGGTPIGNVAGSTNTNVAGPWIDLFGWGMWLSSNGNDDINPTNTSKDYQEYLPSIKTDGETFTGKSAIGAEWTTLTGGNNGEWKYLFNSRKDKNEALLYGVGTVAGVNGVILFPDGWTYPTNLSESSTSEANFTSGTSDWSNSYTAADWANMEANGAVFLPAAGNRVVTGVSDVGSKGYYWSSSAYSESDACNLIFGKVSQGAYIRFYGLSVRLVRPL